MLFFWTLSGPQVRNLRALSTAAEPVHAQADVRLNIRTLNALSRWGYVENTGGWWIITDHGRTALARWDKAAEIANGE